MCLGVYSSMVGHFPHMHKAQGLIHGEAKQQSKAAADTV